MADTLCPDGDHVSFRGARVHVRGYLERFLFEPEQMPMAVGKLSGGEQSRLLLAQLMLREAQLLVLDEPTNDLDLPTLAVLEESLTGFDGAVLLVTHDRYFLDQVATTILAFDTRARRARRGVIPFASLGQWEAWRAETAAAEKARRRRRRRRARGRGRGGGAGARKKLGYKEQREYDAIEATLARAEAALRRSARRQRAAPSTPATPRKLMALLAAVEERQAEVDRLYARWAELEAKLTGA